MNQSNKEFVGNLPWSIYWHPQAKKILDFLYSHIQVAGLVWPTVMILGAAFFTNFDESNPIMWRTFDETNLNTQIYENFLKKIGALSRYDYANHHFLILITLATFTLLTSMWLTKEGGNNKQSWGKYGLIATYALILVWCVHEGFWWLFYIFSLSFNVDYMDFSGLGEIITISLLILTPALGLYAPKKFILVMLGFYCAWLAVGFPITEAYTGNTALYGSLYANSWEYGSWFVGCISFFVLEAKGLFKWAENVQRVLLYRQKGLTNLNTNT